MDHEIELGKLAVVDPSGISGEIVLTNNRAYQHRDSGIFGDNTTIIPYRAITTIRIGWRRAFWPLVLGSILLVLWLLSIVLNLEPLLASIQLPGSIHASAYAHFARYLLVLGGAGLLLLFWFWKRGEIQIMAPTATIGGKPQNHGEARKFCDLLLSIVMRERAMQGEAQEKVAPAKNGTTEEDWRL